MRQVRYVVAASLDGYIAGPGGEADWIIMDPAIDFNALFEPFDTVLMGRRSFQKVVDMGQPIMSGMEAIVFSRTLQPQDYPEADYPEVTIVAGGAEETAADLKAQPGKDIWLFGGGLLFRSLAEAGLVDGVEVAIIPVLLGEGIPLLPPPAPQVELSLRDHKVYPSGIVSLEYDVKKGA